MEHLKKEAEQAIQEAIAKQSQIAQSKQTVAKFEKVSYPQFEKDWIKCFGLTDDIDKIGIMYRYEQIQLPKRKTVHSVGYDIQTPNGISLKPHQSVIIPTGLRVNINKGYWMGMIVRSSLGFKKQTMLSNNLACVESDYYFADNEGHLMVSLINLGESPIHIDSWDAIAQAIFFQQLYAEEDEVTEIRTGGIGSTGR